MHPAFFVGLFVVACAAAAVQSAILNQWDLRQLLAMIVAYTLLLILPPAIAKWLRRE